VHSAVWLGPEARALIHHLKYEGYQQLGDTAAEWIARTRPAPCGQAVLVPVPLSPRRLRRRGYNQAAPIAHALGSRWRLPVSEDILRRVRESESQTALTPEERERNVAGAFAAAPPPAAPGQRGQVGQVAEASWQRLRPRSAPTTSSPPPAPAGCGGAAVIILVDDVLTTGATLAAAARALERAGWEAIGAVTFARALPYELAALHR
jgi:predicted amidophosphoribosyltransferase